MFSLVHYVHKPVLAQRLSGRVPNFVSEIPPKKWPATTIVAGHWELQHRRLYGKFSNNQIP